MAGPALVWTGVCVCVCMSFPSKLVTIPPIKARRVLHFAAYSGKYTFLQPILCVPLNQSGLHGRGRTLGFFVLFLCLKWCGGYQAALLVFQHPVLLRIGTSRRFGMKRDPRVHGSTGVSPQVPSHG